jgi:uncharacterized repeat protein (TIGR01451 family)
MARLVLLLALITSVFAMADAPVAEASISGVALSVKAISAAEGTPFNEAVATFTDAELGDTASAFTAQIEWGDVTPPTAATISGSPAKFTITPGFAGHTYADEGIYTLVVKLTKIAGSESTSGLATASVSEELFASPGSITAVETITFTGVVATFNDPDTGSVAAGFSASIQWGDGTTSAGTVSATGPGSFAVAGSHAYPQDGSFPVLVTITDVESNNSTTSTSFKAHVTEGDELVGAAIPIAATKRVAFSGQLAAFHDTVATAQPSGFTAAIAWGDGTTSAGTITGANGVFAVSGAHTYTSSGSFAVLVTMTAVAPGTVTATATATATVPVLPEADLAVSVVASSKRPRGGKPLTYTVTVANLGPFAAPGVIIGDVLPSRATFEGLSAHGLKCSTPRHGKSGKVTCRLTSLASGAKSTLRLTVGTRKGRGHLLDTATASSTVFDPVSTNNTASVTTAVH